RGQLPQCRDAADVRKLRLGPMQRLLSPLAFSHVHDRPDELQVTRFGLLQSMGNDVEISDRTIGQPQSMLTVETCPLLFGLRDDVPDEGSVVRVSSLQHEVDRRFTGAVAVEDAERLLRPVDLPTGNMPAETAGATQWLSRVHVGRATPQLLFPPL